MRVLVTGGAGFIGSHLCDAFLARGDEVCVIDDLSRGRIGRLPEGVELYRESVLNASRLSALVAEIEARVDLPSSRTGRRAGICRSPGRGRRGKRRSERSTCSRRRASWALA